MNPKRVLITGASGFIGANLLRHLNAHGFEAHSFAAELFADEVIREELKRYSPDWVFHLAGISHVPTCESNPAEAERVNLNGTRNLLQHLSQLPISPRLIFFSTAQVYAAPSADEARSGVVFTEARNLVPQNTYARTKAAAEREVCEWVSQKLDRAAAVIRLFNHTHKTQSGNFFLPHLYETLMKERGKSPMIQVPVGNIDLERDVGSIQDLLAGMTQLLHSESVLRQGHVEFLNFCSGKGKNLRALGNHLAQELGLELNFVTDPARVRAGEPISIVGSSEKFAKLTGWSPTCVTVNDLVKSFLADVS